jgi:hypothetical protein
MFAAGDLTETALHFVANSLAKQELSPSLQQYFTIHETNLKVATSFVSHFAKSCPLSLKHPNNCGRGHESRGYSSRHCMG